MKRKSFIDRLRRTYKSGEWPIIDDGHLRCRYVPPDLPLEPSRGDTCIVGACVNRKTRLEWVKLHGNFSVGIKHLAFLPEIEGVNTGLTFWRDLQEINDEYLYKYFKRHNILPPWFDILKRISHVLNKHKRGSS